VPRRFFDMKTTARDLHRYRGVRKLGRKALRSRVEVYRTGGTSKKSFEACVEIGGLLPGWSSEMKKTGSSYSRSCMFGSNPRNALASALARASRQMKKRRGAFHGIGISGR
jgi:hypothetical protein